MELSIVRETLLLKHKGNVLDFGPYKPTDRSGEKKIPPEKFPKLLSKALFLELNGYWATLPDKTLDAIYDVYEKCIEEIYNENNVKVRQQNLMGFIRKLIDKYHHFDDIVDYMKDKEIIPTDKVKESFDTSRHDSLSRATTYIMSEYRDLACFTIVIRSIFPIWNLINKNSSGANEKAKKVYYEMEMFGMITGTTLMESPAFVRLQEFVLAIWEKYETGKNKNDARGAIMSSVVAGIGTSDIPNYLLATVVVNKLAEREINTFRDTGDLITHVFQRIDNEIKKLADKFARLKARKVNTSGDDEDKTGHLESYRTRERVRRDVHLLSQYYLMDYRKAKKHLDDDIPVSLVKDCIDSFKEFPPVPIRDDQRILVQWVLSGIVAPRTIPKINRPAMINAMALAQAALIHWRLRDVASLLSMYPAPREDDDVLIIIPFDSVSAELKEKLQETFPYYRHTKNTTSRRGLCPGIQTIDNVTKLYADQIWELKCSKTVAKELRLNTGKIKPSIRLKDELAELIIRLDRLKTRANN